MLLGETGMTDVEKRVQEAASCRPGILCKAIIHELVQSGEQKMCLVSPDVLALLISTDFVILILCLPPQYRQQDHIHVSIQSSCRRC